MSIKENIENFLNEHLENTPHFLVEIEQKGTERFPKLFVYVDGDQGIDINTCADISRAVTRYIEDENIIVTEYGIDVSSPGLDRPLQKKRQFIANKGRKLRVWFKDSGKKTDGILLNLDDHAIELEVEKGKSSESMEIPFDNIDKAKVMVSI